MPLWLSVAAVDLQAVEPWSGAPAGADAPPEQVDDGLYFADIMVRGRPIFEVGSVSNLSARSRAATINRRIASVLVRSQTTEAVTIQQDSQRNLTTLQLNNRILMTVTEQDAQDFGLSVNELAENWRDRLNQALEKPPLIIDVAQRLNGTIRQLGDDTLDNLPAFIGGVIVILITWGVAGSIRYAFFAWAKQTEGDRSTEVLIGRLGYGGVWVIGAVVTLGILGLDFGVLLGTLGLTSVAIGFSLKDVLSNYISGVILLAARPFRLNDQVVIGSHEGTITQIQLRATTLQTYDGRTVYIPNQEVFQADIINNTASTHRRSSILVGIAYEADIAMTKQIILDTLAALTVIQHQPLPEVFVAELAASTVNLEIRFWVDSRRIGFLTATSLVTQAVKEALQKADIEMPTEIYTLILRNSPAS